MTMFFVYILFDQKESYQNLINVCISLKQTEKVMRMSLKCTELMKLCIYYDSVMSIHSH